MTTRPEHFAPGNQPPAVSARNRRIGELLKELRLAEALGTGVSKIRRSMAANGSPPPRFQFGEDRGYFTVVLPIHPAAATGPAGEVAGSGRDGLILVSVGADSIRPAVTRSIAGSDLEGARVLLDLAVPDPAEPHGWEAVARHVKSAVAPCLEQPGVERLHLFYRGPLALAPLLGALAATASQPTSIYHQDAARFEPAYTIEPAFLSAED